MQQTAKELRVLLLITDLSCELSETLLRNARTVRTIFETGRNCKKRGREATRYLTSVWIKWMKFNVGVFLSDEEVRHPTEAGRETYPMKWVETHKKNAHLRRDNDYVSTR